MTSPNVIVAIPNYNMGKQVSELLPQLSEQGFEHIYVLDDKSTDSDTLQFYSELGDKAVVLHGERNVGAAGNRNRIIQALGANGLKEDDIVLFIDADAKLTNKPLSPKAIQELFDMYPEAGAIGGMVLNANGSWGAFNYGPLSLPKWLRGTPLQLKMERLCQEDPARAKALVDRYSVHFQDWPNPLAEPQTKEVGWLVETMVCIRLGLFKQVGGYDDQLRYCEALDLGMKLEKQGLKRVFEPSLAVRHLQIDNRGWHRNIEVAAAVARLSWRRMF